MKTTWLSAILLASVLPLGAANIFSENFEGATLGIYSTGSTITGTLFRVAGSNASVDIVGPGDYGHLCAAPAANGFCLDSTGSGGNRGFVETISMIAFGPGSYNLSIGITRWNDTVSGGGEQDATIRVSIGSVFTQTYVVDSSWVNGIVIENFTVGALTNARLQIEDLSGSAGFAGAIVDSISIDDSINSVPEPSTYFLAAAGLVSLALRNRKR
jgi:hypothetical protein